MDKINIEQPDINFKFNELSLGKATSIMNGFYYSPISILDSQSRRPNDLYIQTPEITSKTGLISGIGSKEYIDLVFNNSHENILEWFENLENRMKVLIYNIRHEWFSEQSSIELHDIENLFISPIRTYKSGKQFVLRTHVESPKNNLLNITALKIYDIHQNEINMNSFSNDDKFVSLLKISGLKFSARTFQIYVEIKQIMIVNRNDTFNSCLISLQDKNITNEGEHIHEEHEKIIQEDVNVHANEANEATESNEANESNEDTNIEVTTTTTDDNTIGNVHMNKEDNDITISDSDNISQNLQIIEYGTKSDGIDEIQVSLDTLEDSDIKIQDIKNEHIELYKSALKKAKELRRKALESHLEAQNIKAQYLMNIYSDSDSEDNIESEEDEEEEVNI